MVRDSTTVKPGRSGDSDCWKDEREKSNYPDISLFIFSTVFIQKCGFDLTVN